MATTTPADNLPDSMILPTRAQLIDRFKRSWGIRHRAMDPTGQQPDTGPGTVPALVASVMADRDMPIYANLDIIARSTLIKNARGARLAAIGESKGIFKLPPTNSTGFVIISTNSSGGQIIAGDTLVDELTGNEFEVLNTDIYTDGAQVGIRSLDTGPESNVDADVVLTFSNPRPGVQPKVTVVEQTDGTGLSGGHDEETDEEYIGRIIQLQSSPPASGNASEFILAIEDKIARATGVPVEKAFCVPAWQGPGTVCLYFTVRPNSAGNRVPNSVQMGLIQAGLESMFPGDDSIVVAFLGVSDLGITLSVQWRKGVTLWADVTPWPVYVPPDQNADHGTDIRVSATPAPTSTSMRVYNSWLLFPLATVAPQIGQTIAVYDVLSQSFKRKKILTVTVVTAGFIWDLTFDTANNASDLFIPVKNKRVSPWSDSLNLIPASVVAYMGSLGPGEMYSTFPDAGQRQRRQPQSPESYPSTVTNADLVTAVKNSGAVADVKVLLPFVPYNTPIGTPGIIAGILRFADLGIYPE